MIADYIDRRLLSGIATSSDSEELAPMDDDLFDLVTVRQPMTISFPSFKNQTMNGLTRLF